MSLLVIAEKMATPTSSAHGLTKTLQSRGCLYGVSRRHGYYWTTKLNRQAEAISTGSPVLSQINPHLQRLCDELAETVVLGKRQGDAITYLDVVECRKRIRFSSVVGEVTSLHCAARGKAILGAMGLVELPQTLARMKLDKRTDESITSATKLNAELAAHRRCGWYHVIGENIADMMSIAATVVDEIYVVGAGEPSQPFKPLMTRHATQLLKTCKEIEQALN